MKYIIATIVILAILAGIYFAFFQTQVTTESIVSGQSQPVIVSMIRKTVQHVTASSTHEVIDPTQAYEGDMIKTLSEGRGLVEMKNGTITVIDYSSELKIKSHTNDEHSSMYLVAGDVWSRVKKVFDHGEFYEIETQNAVAVVRGTSFGVSYNNGVTTLEVTSGTVAFIPIDPKTRERKYDQTIYVTAGKKATIGDSGVISVTDLTLDDKKNEWFIYNNDVVSQSATGTTTPEDLQITNILIQR